ncbi:MAG: HYR domain-containing protein, partial [Saprospiraceae bacterium]|nr:HYR domain-containing protein [Saprospiraceae bacterium]
TQTEFDCDDVGIHTTIVMVTDTCGNSNTCSTVIEIVDDQAPTCVTVDITVSLDSNGEYDLDASEVDDGSSAACGGMVTLAVDPNEFDCSDIGDQLVTLTVSSSGGVSSTCTAEVTIQDNSPPTIVCPANMTLPCNSDLSDLTQFGMATASDNCDANVAITVNNIFDVNACNVGTVEREFTATDNEGNTATCMQLITIDPPTNPIVEADITWPTSPFDAGDCIADPANIDSGMPVVNTSNADCFNISISFFDVDPTPGTSGCFDTYERNWMVVDSCQLNGGTTGIFTFVQIINLNDSVGPTISGPADMTIILDPMTCDTFLNLPATISDCIGGFSGTNDSPFADSNATEDATGTYSAGATDVTITAIDTCGNESFYTYTVNVIDTSTVIFSCDKIIETMTSALVVPVPVEAAEIEIMTMCSDTVFDVSFSNMSPDIDTIYADCSFVGLTNYTVYLWSGNVVIDSCTNLLQILDGGGFCPNPLIGTISGLISTEDDRMVDDVVVDLMGSEFPAILTEEDGIFAFPAMPYGGSYEVVPVKDTDHLNGVSTLDLIEIQRHILGIQPLTSPYKLIAADVDNSGSITSLDLLELRKLILGVYEEFPNNTSWRMVDAAYNFIDPYNPFLYDIPEDYEIGLFNTSMDINFIGVKVGDVNNTAVANLYDQRIEARSASDFSFVVNDQKLKKGELSNIVFSAESMEKVDGYQYTLKIDRDKVEFVGFNPIDPTMDLNNVNLSHSDNGIIHISWNKLSDYGNELTQLFEIVVKPKSDVWVSDVASVLEKGIPAQAYFENEIQDLKIEFRNDEIVEEDIILYQNQPNPWLQSTDIKFYSPVSGDVILKVYDINGRVVHSRNMTSSIGLNKIELRKDDVGSASGILYYELISGNERLMEKMLLLR